MVFLLTKADGISTRSLLLSVGKTIAPNLAGVNLENLVGTEMMEQHAEATKSS
jgi:hypothetical protein